MLRRDKLEAPYYMNTKIRLSSCLDNGEKGLIHAMNILNHNRMYNLTEDKYNEIRTMIMSKNDEEFKNLYENYHELFEKIDNLID